MKKVALIAVQLEVNAEVVASPQGYRNHICDMVACAVEDAGPAEAKLIVLPEVCGHLALLALAPPAAHKRRTLGEALAMAAVRRPLEVLRGVATTRQLHPRAAVLAALAPDGERFWRHVMGPLARKHDAYVVAGSHLRLGPDGDLTNASFLFAPDGRCVGTTDKVNLVPGVEDGAPKGLGLARGDADQLPITSTLIGRVVTLVGYDGFRIPHTTLERFVPLAPRVKARGGVAFVANPCANTWPWDGPWPPPRLAHPNSEHATRAVQWEQEGLAASLREVRFARFGVTSHLVGGVLDLVFDGASQIVACDRTGVRELARATSARHGGHVVATVTC